MSTAACTTGCVGHTRLVLRIRVDIMYDHVYSIYNSICHIKEF